ncbi:MAG TPA: Rpn family recombination-promoting nuclease/putative transposase [Kofleriaceae bacterium]|jgi:predicted transposase/invertase (TIGR01784 family)|nr:Rpn family recombination-promoting nuclease/putative transposase [Kofleriaceae bacterium]
MAFADLKNDYIFRKIFATHPELLRRLLNDLLERTGAQTIEYIEYLPGEQLPLVEGAKLSILDVRCKDRTGTTFVVEMQLIHHPGFINRVVYNACKAYAGQLQEGDWYTKLTDVVAISICDFALWPDSEQDQQGLPRVPMLSRWHMTERTSGNDGLLQVQYVFLELPKLPARRPDGHGADLWAWLFVHAPELTEIPPEFVRGPYGDALELANKAKFSMTELQAYEKARDEIRQVHEIAHARWLEGEAKGKIEGKIEGRREVLVRLFVRAGIALTDAERSRIDTCMDAETLDGWIDKVFAARTAAEVLT